MKKKLVGVISIISILFLSCIGTKQIGNLTMISTRNVDSKLDYSMLYSYAGGSKNELKKSKAATLEEAVDVIVRNVAGGEFLKNVKIYEISKFKNVYFAIEGDVWGVKTDGSTKGFSPGDTVQWSDITGKHVGKITGMINNEKCAVQEEGKTTSVTVKFSNLIKIIN